MPMLPWQKYILIKKIKKAHIDSSFMNGEYYFMQKKWVWWGLILIFLGCDQGSKALILSYYKPYELIAVFPGLNILLVYNSGSAFGFLNQSGSVWHQWFFTVFSLLMSIILVAWMIRLPWKAKWQLLGLSLIVSGALGNMIDRLRFGYVIDFIDLYFYTYHWFIFNIADSAICIGAVILFLSSQENKVSVPSKKRRSHSV